MADSGKRADWTYRIGMAAMTAGIAWGVNWIGGKVDVLSSLPGQVRSIATDQDQLKAAVNDVKKAQDDAKKVQEDLKEAATGFATGAQVQGLRSDVDNLTGRVDAMQEQVNSVTGRRPPK